MKSKQIYQDTKGNCVFVGFDEKGTAKFGAVRTMLTDRKYRGDCKNSDKRYAFHQIGTDTTRLYVFEAPIDLLSHCTLVDQTYGAGKYKDQTRLALCGSSDVALEAFLKRNPQVRCRRMQYFYRQCRKKRNLSLFIAIQQKSSGLDISGKM